MKSFVILLSILNFHLMLSHLKRYIFSIIVALTIIYLSLFKPPKTPVDMIPHMDKIVHLCMYGGLTGVIWLEYLFSRSGMKPFKWLTISLAGVLFPICFGGIMELLQEFMTTYRSGDWMDFLANSTGVILATCISYFILKPLIAKYKGYN